MDISEVKRLIEDQGRAWEEFKKTNDEAIKAKADGKAVGDLEAKLATIGEKLDKVEGGFHAVRRLLRLAHNHCLE